MPSCQNFKQKIAEFKNKTEGLRRDLERYKSGENIYSNISDKVEELERKVKEFRKEYEEKSKEMIKEWWPYENKEDFIQDLEFDKDGRIIKQQGNIAFSHKSHCFYFPNLIKKINGNFNVQFLDTKHIDNLEEVNHLIFNYNPTILSFKALKKIEYLFIRNSTVMSFDNLEEIKRGLDIRYYNIKKIEEFMKVFPKLRKIGKAVSTGISFFLSSNQTFLKLEIEKLRDKGKLEVEGTIKIE